MIGYFDKAQKIISSNEDGGEVWISGLKFAEDVDAIKENKFSLVVSCMKTNLEYSGGLVYHMKFPIEDSETFDIKAYFQPSFEVIEAGRKSGNVLIHSEMGISRSGAIMISYLIQKQKQSFKEGLAMIKKKRPCVEPNPNFVRQLEWFQKFKKM